MKINTFFYSIVQGLKNIFRNGMFSLASIATMSACIFMFGLFYILIMNINVVVQNVEEGVAITVFFEPGIEEDKILAVRDDVALRTEVKEVNYVSAEDAWEYFKEVYFKDYEYLAEGFINNPLVNSANLEVYLNDVSKQTGLVTYIESIEGVREVKQSQHVANTLTEINQIVSVISTGIILILLCVAIFLINNTVSVGISVRKEEIAIMKLIGATDFLVRFPFVVEGLVIGLVGALIPMGLLYLIYDRIAVYVAKQFILIGGFIDFIPVKTLFQGLAPVAILLGVGIGFVGSMWTIRKHLKV